jgi:hypothetical protein
MKQLRRPGGAKPNLPGNPIGPIFLALTLSVALLASWSLLLPDFAPAEEGTPLYGSPGFDALIADSYRLFPGEPLPSFETFLDRAIADAGLRYRDTPPTSLVSLLEEEKNKIAAIADPAGRAEAETRLAVFLHAAVKRAIPRFSLDRGFEFANAVRLGERQCFLQAVLISACLRRGGVDAGSLMVWANEKGRISNLGHAVAFVRLADGRILLVDASDPTPFVRHRGIYAFLAGRGRTFLRVEYASDAPSPTRLTAAGDGSEIPADRLVGLPSSFLRSQFDYYRGERAPGGILAPSKTRTPSGLENSIRLLSRSVSEDPANPLALYTLGRALRKAGREDEARRDIASAASLYRDAGYLPPGVRDALQGH